MSDEEVLAFIRWAEKTHSSIPTTSKTATVDSRRFHNDIHCRVSFRVTGWLPYARADNIEEARMKAANAFIKTRHTVVRITEERR